MSTETKCEICGENHPFEFPNGLVATALRGDLVVFAGAGVSTEARRVYPNTFAESIAHELALKRNERALPFPEIMSRYEERFGRRQLLQRIRSRLDYMEGFPELLDTAARFHKELATAHFMSDIVTTNWDTLFEDYSAATPFVVPDDYAFWEVGRRKVFKLHGSMRNLGTIVATTRDYQRCYRRLRGGTIGATFKHMLATRSIVFIGYSFGDFDLNRLIAFVKREMGDVLPRSYLVTPHGYEGDDFPQDRVVRTDGTYFIERLKDAAINLGFMRPGRHLQSGDAAANQSQRSQSASRTQMERQESPAGNLHTRVSEWPAARVLSDSGPSTLRPLFGSP